MSILPFTEKDLTENFAGSFLEQGKNFQREGLVKNLQFSIPAKQLTAEVSDARKQPYKPEIKITHDDDGLWIDGTCDCEIGFNCQHVTAVLWEAIQHYSRQVETNPDIPVLTEAQPAILNGDAERIVYILSQQYWQQQHILQVEPCLVRPLKSGYYSKPKAIPPLHELQNILLPVDEHLLKWLAFSRKQDFHAVQGTLYKLAGTNGAALLPQLIMTGRCHWITSNSPALGIGEARQGKLEWAVEPNGQQRLLCHVPGESCTLFLLNPLWYLDHQHHLCGPLRTDIDSGIVYSLLTSAALKPEQIQQLHSALLKRNAETKDDVPVPVTHEKTARIKPVPQLTLKLANIQVIPHYSQYQQIFEMQLPVAEIKFLYNATAVGYGDPTLVVDAVENDQLTHYKRDFKAESAAIHYLKTQGLIPLQEVSQYRISGEYPQYWVIHPEFEQHPIVQFSLLQVPELRRIGWHVIIDDNYPYIVVEEAEADWYSVIDEQESRSWFDLELGIMINGERINVLPLLIDLIEQYFTDLTPGAIQAIPPETKLLARLPDGRYLPVPIERVRTILQVLTELYDTESLSGGQRLRLSKLRAAQLSELESAIGSGRFRWFGGEQIRKLGERLKNFAGIADVPLPHNFQAELRPYQQEGLNWLQFLREYGLAGVLADDMGLGKTVQTLAHILVEKQSGRMAGPNLVIAPTSLMVNWYMEAKRFAPDLKVLILHGSHRKPFFEQLSQYDLILTTYPLLVRDKAILLEQQYHLLILDEAQIIKNPKAKSAQIVQIIKAQHRLCLTGTPMENHLGELWSIFHFLMPGLLGEQEQFKKLYRNPIEKLGDAERRQVLAKRIAPFLLRRTKQGVVNELPPKSEIIRMVELESGQRDLYESIRAALHSQVTQAIQSKGLASSQIVILDALLKLRQTCCDPRLLKLPSVARFNAGSAKLELLMDMLPSLIEEGRRILLFSQFTGMLGIIEAALKECGIDYVILTGKTKDRAAVIEKFQSGRVPLFLISLKAGGTGLNLTAADTVIHYDPWWNPAVESQATDRAYRIGQDKPVFVYKLLTANTVEEKIQALQEKKRALIQELYANNPGKAITQDDLLNLLMND